MIGAQVGLTPEQVLDMNIAMLNAYLEGYQERLFDQKCLAVHQGFWAGYYHSKKPKSPKTVLQQMSLDYRKEKRKEKNKKRGKLVKKPDVDVATYLAREQRFRERLQRGE